MQQLVAILQKINFTLDSQTYSFNKDGDFDNGYDLIMWRNDSEVRVPDVVGKFLIEKNDVEVYEHKIPWTNHTVPLSRCSDTCPPGKMKSVSNISCCYTCTNCTDGYFSNSTDQDACQKCPDGFSSLPGSSECQEWNIWYLKWSAPYSIVVMIGTGIGVLLLVFSFTYSILYRNNPIIKDTLLYSCLMKFGLLVSFGGLIPFLGRPYADRCMAQQAMYGLGFTLCVSCILTKAFRTFKAYMASDPNTQHKLEKIDKPFIIISLLTALQGLIFIFWFIFDHPGVEETESNTQQLTMNCLCTQGESMVSFGVMHTYIAVLAVVCFLLAFKGKDDETEPIVFSMLIHLFAWLCFIPVFITQKELRPITQISAIMVSNYGVIFCHFTPKWFKIISEKMENNNRLNVIREQATETISDSASSIESLTSTDPTPLSFNEPDAHVSEEPSVTSQQAFSIAENEALYSDFVANSDSSEEPVLRTSSTISSTGDSAVSYWNKRLNQDSNGTSTTTTTTTTTTRTNTAQVSTKDLEMPVRYRRQQIVLVRRHRASSF